MIWFLSAEQCLPMMKQFKSPCTHMKLFLLFFHDRAQNQKRFKKAIPCNFSGFICDKRNPSSVRVLSINPGQQYISFWFLFCEQEYSWSGFANEMSGFHEGVSCILAYNLIMHTPSAIITLISMLTWNLQGKKFLTLSLPIFWSCHLPFVSNIQCLSSTDIVRLS